MFIKSSQSGYSRNGEQFARGSFLIVFSHNSFKWEEQNNTPHTELTGQTFDVTHGDGFTIQKVCQCGGTGLSAYKPNEKAPSYYLKYCPVHGTEYKTMPKDLERKLYACVRHVSLRQLGHWMMGTARIADQSLTLSGSYGSDGLPCDYEKLTESARTKLIELPAELIEEFWKGGGHNCAGSEASAMRNWALATFKK